MKKLALMSGLALALLLAIPAAAVLAEATVTPIWSGETSLPDFVGAAAKARPTADSGVPQDPYLAPNPLGGVHLDAWNSDVADLAGPLGRAPVVWTSTLAPPRLSPAVPIGATQAFDSHGRPVVAYSNAADAGVVLLDPVTLAVLTSYPLHTATGNAALGSCYFYVDARDQVVIADGADQIITLREAGTEAQPQFEKVAEESYDLSSIVPAGDRLGGVIVDWRGRIWFDTRGSVADGVAPGVGVIDPRTWPDVGWLRLRTGEQISNTIAVTKQAAFVVTSRRMYEIAAGADAQPHVVWRRAYQTTGQLKPGQYSLGSGTSPTIFGRGRYVAIADNAEQVHVVVYRTGQLKHGQTRVVGEPMPVFRNMAGSAVENSLLCMRDSIVVENVYGYAVTKDGTQSPSLPGFERIDVTRDGRALRKVWVNDDVASTYSPRLSTRTGLVYTESRKVDPHPGPGTDGYVYYLTALDFRTGKTVWEKRLGAGFNFDGYYPGVEFGLDGTVYMVVYGGIIAVRDGS